MKHHSALATRTRRPVNKSARRPAKVSEPKAVTVPLDPIAQALDRWLTLCVSGKPIPQRVWDELDTACGELQAHQVRGNGPKSNMVRAWLGYRAAQAAVQRGALRRTDTAFQAAYLAWQSWKAHGRHARA
jgi:hypothetical protein